MSLTFDVVLLAGGFLLGWFTALALRIWQSRIDEHIQHYDELRNAILQAADISTDYWLKVDALSDRQAEARLVGLFRLLNGLAVDLARTSKDDPQIHARHLVKFGGLTTGGPDYEVDTREINVPRAMAVQLEAADLMVHFRKYRRRRLTLWHSLNIAFSK